MGRMKRSYFTGRRVNPGPTNVGLVICRGRGTKSVYVSHALRTVRTYHTLPALLLGLLSCLNHREHLFLRDTLDLRQGDGETGGLLVTLLLDGR